ncbi:MAG: hypothetical protein HYU74_07100 [Dechloromonas sp.]|nr:hypothetical protein [Dechloromonas sp.]
MATSLVDAVAMPVNNAENDGGDQTGIDNGWIVAGIIRYAIQRDLAPVFVTAKPNLGALLDSRW